MRPIFEQQYYDAIRSYVPEDAKRVLDEQVPVIRQKISEEIDAFAESLSADIKKTLDDSAKEQTEALRVLRATFATEVAAISAHHDPALKNAAKALNDAIDSYQAKFASLGATARTAVAGVAKAYGLPLSFP
jgi:hypothetical protein